MESRNCQNCKKEFIIDQDDINFYTKIKVPHPTFCPECRFLRRVSFFNLSKFYRRACDKCGKNTVGLHSSDKPYNMYCNTCWWNDSWDGTEYGMDYDPSKNFFDQLIELRNKSNFMALESLHPSNLRTEYTNNSSYQKDSFMTMYADYVENSAYIIFTAYTKDSLDCYRIKESERCYECSGVFKSYNCTWCEEIDGCIDTHFSRSCYGCTNCIGCINLRNKSYCILNEQYSKEEYFEKLKELKLNTYSGQQNFLFLVKEFWKKFPRRSYIGNSLNVNVSGEYVYESKNVKNGYLMSGGEDCRYVQYLNLASSKDCYDYTGWGAGSELIYECFITGDGAYNNRFSAECWPQASNVEYSYFCIQGKDCFGCVNLKRKQYCILNKQYSKEEYEILKARIIEDMKNNLWKSKNGSIYSYGEFLPPELSPFGYNETVAFEYLPLEKDKVDNLGYNWFDIKNTTHTPTILSLDLPEKIDKVHDAICNEIIKCSTCDKSFNIVKLELEILKKLDQPLPRSCYNCRHLRRFELTNKMTIYDRNCDKCGIFIKTSYSPDRPEIVYCEKCYQQEVL